jgi:hypothetical protein
VKDRIAAFTIALAFGGCAAKQPSGATPSAEESAPAMDGERDAATAESSFEDYLARLERAEAELQRQGVVLDDGEGVEAGGMEGMSEPQRSQRCQRICGLASDTCELRGKICGLADAHASQARYAAVCERATKACERATQACNACAK